MTQSLDHMVILRVYTLTDHAPRVCAVEEHKSIGYAAADIWQSVYGERTKNNHDYRLGALGVDPGTPITYYADHGPLLLQEIEPKEE